MRNFGSGELLLVAVFALLVFGPRRLPEIARSIGRALRELRRATGELSEELKLGLEETPEDRPPPSTELRPGPRA
ncbi:MAG: Sec-independent protein translocase subunit TatA/TatB [Candidatus Methylomirabilales bacterium]